MKCAKAMDWISRCLDGNLSAQKREKLDSHMRECRECRNLFEDFRKIVEEAQELEVLDPPEGTWAGIQKDLESRERKPQGSPFRRKGFSLSGLRPAVSVTAAALVVVCAGVLILGPRFWPTRLLSERENGNTALVKLGKAEKHYQLAIKAWTEALEASRENMDPQVLEFFQDNLELINTSLQACKQAVIQNPNDIDSRRFLLAAYKKKMDLLSKMVSFDTESDLNIDKKSKT